jgi:thymidine phosphorylase
VEVIEAIEALKGKGEPDLMEVTFELAARMLFVAGDMTGMTKGAREPGSQGARADSFLPLSASSAKSADKVGIPDRVPGTSSRQRAYAHLNRALHTGSALRCFREMVKAQGGNARVVNDYSLLPAARHQVKAVAPRSGYVQEMATLRIGMLSVQLGAGRARKEDRIDPAVGFWFRRKIGDRVEQGEVLAEVLANDREKGKEIAAGLQDCYRIGKSRAKPPKLILERIGTADKLG